VREQWRRHHVADGIDTFLSGLLVLVDLYETFLDFDLCAFQTEPFSERHAAYGHQKHFGFQLYVFAFRSFAGDDDALVGLLKLLEFCIDLRFDTAFAKRLGELARNLFVFQRNYSG